MVRRCVCLIHKNNFFLFPVRCLSLISEKEPGFLSSTSLCLLVPSENFQALRGNVTVWQEHPYFMPEAAEPSIRQAYCTQLVQRNWDSSHTSPAETPSHPCQRWDLWETSVVRTQTSVFPSNAVWRYPLSYNATFYSSSATALIHLSLNMHFRLIHFCCTSSDLLCPVLFWSCIFREISHPGGNTCWWWVQFHGEWFLATNLTGLSLQARLNSEKGDFWVYSEMHRLRPEVKDMMNGKSCICIKIQAIHFPLYLAKYKEMFMPYQATNVFLWSGKADSGSQHSTKSKGNEGNRFLGTTSFISDIAVFLYHPLLQQRWYGRTHSVGQYQSSLSTEKRELEPKNEKGGEIPREDRQHLYTWHEDSNPWLTWPLNLAIPGIHELPGSVNSSYTRNRWLGTIILLAEKESEFLIADLLFRFIIFLKHIRDVKSVLKVLGFSA